MWNPEIMLLLLWNICVLCIAQSQLILLRQTVFALDHCHLCLTLQTQRTLDILCFKPVVIKEGLASLHLSVPPTVLVPQFIPAECRVPSEWLQLAADRSSCNSCRRESVTPQKKNEKELCKTVPSNDGVLFFKNLTINNCFLVIT